MIKWKKLSLLLGATALILFLCSVVLPLGATIPWLGTVRNNLKEEIDATPYFYTEVEDIARYEQAVRKKRSAGAPLRGD